MYHAGQSIWGWNLLYKENVVSSILTSRTNASIAQMVEQRIETPWRQDRYLFEAPVCPRSINE